MYLSVNDLNATGRKYQLNFCRLFYITEEKNILSIPATQSKATII